MTQTDAPPADIFTTRDGKTIALKPWTLGLIAQHASQLSAFIQTFADITTDGPAELDRIKDAIPAIEASVQTPNALEGVVGLAELIRLAESIWAYNEIGVGLGKAVALSAQIQGQVLGASEGLLALSPE